MQDVSFTLQDLIAACAAIITISGAAGVIIKIIGTVRRPTDDLSNKVQAIEDRVNQHDRLLSNDHDQLASLEEGSRVTQRAILALLDHGLDGNNVEQMRSAKAALQNHLIER